MFRVCHVPQAGYNLKGLNGWGTASTAGAAACDLPPSLTANDGVGDYNKVQHDRPTASGGGADATSHKHNTGVSCTSTVNQSAFAAACSAGHWYMIAHNTAAAHPTNIACMQTLPKAAGPASGSFVGAFLRGIARLTPALASALKTPQQLPLSTQRLHFCLLLFAVQASESPAQLVAWRFFWMLMLSRFSTVKSVCELSRILRYAASVS